MPNSASGLRHAEAYTASYGDSDYIVTFGVHEDGTYRLLSHNWIDERHTWFTLRHRSLPYFQDLSERGEPLPRFATEDEIRTYVEQHIREFEEQGRRVPRRDPMHNLAALIRGTRERSLRPEEPGYDYLYLFSDRRGKRVAIVQPSGLQPDYIATTGQGDGAGATEFGPALDSQMEAAGWLLVDEITWGTGIAEEDGFKVVARVYRRPAKN